MSSNFTPIRMAIAQLNFLVGDIHANAQKIITHAKLARDKHQAQLLILPELALTGYPPEDLLFREDFHLQIQQAIKLIARDTSGIDIVFGYPEKTAQGIYNAASLLSNGQIVATYHKQCLPNYGVFDEKRYFISGNESCVITYQGIKLGLLICEDLWFKEPVLKAKQAGAELILSLNASPFDLDKESTRVKVIRERIAESGLGIIYAHGTGGQDEIVFDGGSCVFNAQAEICYQAAYFQETLMLIDVKKDGSQLKFGKQITASSITEEYLAYSALVLGVKDYVHKNNFPGVLVGLSGGIDSALTLAIAVDALGADKVHAVSMPSPYTSQLSIDLAQEMADLLKVKLSLIRIDAIVNGFTQALATDLAGYLADQTEENIQARCRGTLLMALSNKTSKLVLTTGNKSEMAVGYATLYGDMAGGFAVLKDVYKTLVYRLADYRNALARSIPQPIIDRPPTAELKPDQTDQDTLPPYAILDKILQLYIEGDQSAQAIISMGFDENTVKAVIRMVDRNEYKRRQAPPGIRITQRAFGRDRRYPITNGFKHHE